MPAVTVPEISSGDRPDSSLAHRPPEYRTRTVFSDDCSVPWRLPGEMQPRDSWRRAGSSPKLLRTAERQAKANRKNTDSGSSSPPSKSAIRSVFVRSFGIFNIYRHMYQTDHTFRVSSITATSSCISPLKLCRKLPPMTSESSRVKTAWIHPET